MLNYIGGQSDCSCISVEYRWEQASDEDLCSSVGLDLNVKESERLFFNLIVCIVYGDHLETFTVFVEFTTDLGGYKLQSNEI